MTRLTKKEVLHVAELSNLKLSENEVKKFLPQLSKIIEYVSQLSGVDTKEIKPTSQTTGLTNVYRENLNELGETLTQEEVLSNTDGYNGFFKIPAILEGRTNK
ncbi:MAG: Asp-tRNA(Asn)/Glu-tRNA(Gln) amidotransferase subunit GatC [Candidatus Woesebacteria bacterium]|nr:Asp-tRNA(Asn)/Glu-tRNA(Gln) amidotransferase subunit GatC [Candidatus Woesebacteria bacterium]